jgi:hypothetical protein
LQKLKLENEDFNKMYWGIFGRGNGHRKKKILTEPNRPRSPVNSNQENSQNHVLATMPRQHAVSSSASQKPVQILVVILFIRFLVFVSFGL